MWHHLLGATGSRDPSKMTNDPTLKTIDFVTDGKIKLNQIKN